MPKNDLINRAHCKDFILEQAKLLRPGWNCSRVSKTVLDDLNHRLKMIIRGSVKRHPTKGRTFMQLS